ncbi:MAG: hypothetical protein AB7O24_28610 [Kofleriaceae bacterium]
MSRKRYCRAHRLEYEVILVYGPNGRTETKCELCEQGEPAIAEPVLHPEPPRLIDGYLSEEPPTPREQREALLHRYGRR